MPINFDNEIAFAPLAESVLWQQDRPPRRVGAFSAIVTHGVAESSAAGHSLGPVVGDAWSVHVSPSVAVVADIRPGDRIVRRSFERDSLTVQKVTRDESGWWLVCTANVRAPK